ncbi:MAG: ATP-binding protein, partial [Bacteroidia bacterium]
WKLKKRAIYFKVHKNLHVIANFIDVKKVAWDARSAIINTAGIWFKNKWVEHIYVVGPNIMLRTMLHLGLKLFPNVSLSVHATLQDAKNSYRKEGVYRGKINASDLKNIIENNQEHPIFRARNKFIDSQGNSVFTALIEPNIFVSQYTGMLTDETINFVFDFAWQNFPKIKNHYYSILDTTRAKGVTSNGRKVFAERAKEVKPYVRYRYYKFGKLLKALVKGYAFINKDFGRETVIIDDFYSTIIQVLRENTPITNTEIEPEKLTRNDLEQLTKDELINIVIAAYDDSANYKQKVLDDTQRINEGLSNIDWNQDYKVTPLNADDTLPEFYNLFQDINRIQFEAAGLINKLEFRNKDLNLLVEKRTQEIERKSSSLRSLMESYDSPVWLIDNNFNLLDLNPSFYNIIKHGFGVELAKGENILGYFNDEIKAFWKEKYELALKGRIVEFNQEYNTNENYGTYYYKVFPIKIDNNIMGCGVIGNNITDLVKTENKLKSQNKTLIKLNEELDTFIYRSSHDMRAPIATLLGLVDMVKNETDEAKRQQCFAFMNDSVQKLDGFIHEITELTKNSKYEIESTQINLKNFIDNILVELAYMSNYSKSEIQLNFSSSLTLKTDKFRLKTILKNLISNSIKYANPNKKSLVNINAIRTNDMLVIEVEDNGQGIPPHLQEKVFNMFYRANLTSKGSGLGLYIVKETVNKLNGQVELKSNYGQGTSVKVSLKA